LGSLAGFCAFLFLGMPVKSVWILPLLFSNINSLVIEFKSPRASTPADSEPIATK
jgi:hypothetical protein